jgi:hypothetical protein
VTELEARNALILATRAPGLTRAIAQKVAFALGATCPTCGNSRNLLVEPWGCLAKLIVHCHSCREEKYRRWRASLEDLRHDPSS